MTALTSLIKRNNKIFFKDKGMLITSLITPMILLVLYATFLARVYEDAFTASVPPEFSLDKSIINGLVGGQLVSSLLAVSCVTVSFCSNLLMVQDKISGARRDLTVSPVKAQTLSLAYFISSASVTMLISLVALFAGLVYLAFTGWYLSFSDVFLLLFDIILLVLFATSLSSIINCSLKSNGQASAVGTIVSSGYGFICGAYMPISNFPEVLQHIVLFLPGTYGTSLLRNHAINGVYAEMKKKGLPAEVIEEIRDATDINLYFFDNPVSEWVMYLVLAGSVVLISAAYVLLCKRKKMR